MVLAYFLANEENGTGLALALLYFDHVSLSRGKLVKNQFGTFLHCFQYFKTYVVNEMFPVTEDEEPSQDVSEMFYEKFVPKVAEKWFEQDQEIPTQVNIH